MYIWLFLAQPIIQLPYYVYTHTHKGTHRDRHTLPSHHHMNCSVCQDNWGCLFSQMRFSLQCQTDGGVSPLDWTAQWEMRQHRIALLSAGRYTSCLFSPAETSILSQQLHHLRYRQQSYSQYQWLSLHFWYFLWLWEKLKQQGCKQGFEKSRKLDLLYLLLPFKGVLSVCQKWELTINSSNPTICVRVLSW